MTEPLRWIEDGHKLIFRLVRDVVEISHIVCPFDGKNAVCNSGREYCVVQRFVGVYGTEICIGTADISGPVEIAWVPTAGSGSDLDRDFDQVWMIPVRDADYMAAKMGIVDEDLDELT